MAGEVDDEEEMDAVAEALWLKTCRAPDRDPDIVLRLPFRAARMP